MASSWRVRVRHPQVGDGVLRVELEDLLEDVEGVSLAPLVPQPRRDLVVGRQGVAGQSQLGVDLGQARDDVAVLGLEMAGVALDDPADLLVDRDGFDREPLTIVVLADPLVGGDGALVLLYLQVEIADLEQGAHVTRIVSDELLVLRDRLVVPFFVDKFLRDLEDLLAIDRHLGWCSSNGGACSAPHPETSWLARAQDTWLV
jgi:hypothetical protein